MRTVYMKDGPITGGDLVEELRKFPPDVVIKWDGCCNRRMQLHSLSNHKEETRLVFDFFAPKG